MKGIMFTFFFKLFLSLYFCAYLVSADAKDDVSSTTTTTTTAKPLDLSGAETYETSVHVLHPGESLSRSKSLSYSQSSQDYRQQNPDYEKGAYEENTDSYGDGRENNYNQVSPEQQSRETGSQGYTNSYEGAHQQQYHGNQEQNYGGPSEERNNHPYPDHAVKDPNTYGQQTYAKEEGAKEGSYGDRRPPFHYAYEVSGHHQSQSNYGSSDESNNAEKSDYRGGEAENYSPKGLQQAEYYPKPNPTRYVFQEIHKDDYRSGDQKESYFSDVPKEAGYASNGQNEPGYLQSPPSEPSYSKQAGYSPRNTEPTAFLPMFPKEKPVGSTNDGKVAVYIKHLGHKNPGTNEYVNKERQGFLLLPVVHQKMEDKLKELKDQFEQEFKQNYQEDKPTDVKQSPVPEKEAYIQPKVVHYPVNAKVATVQHVPAYSLDQEPVKAVKTVISHESYGNLRPVIKHTTYESSKYRSSNPTEYSVDDASVAGPYIPPAVTDYEKPEVKSYARAALVYGGPRRVVVPTFTGSIKYKAASLYPKTPDYSPSYDVTTEQKSVPIKVKDYRPSSFSSLYHAVGYPRITDLSSIANRGKKSIPISSHLYSSDSPFTANYEHSTLKTSSPDHERSLSEFLQKPKESDVVAFRPSSYSSKGRVSAKELVHDFDLHDYESLLSKPRHGGSSVGSLYYDLHTFPAEHFYTRYGYRRSGVIPKLAF